MRYVFALDLDKNQLNRFLILDLLVRFLRVLGVPFYQSGPLWEDLLEIEVLLEKKKRRG